MLLNPDTILLALKATEYFKGTLNVLIYILGQNQTIADGNILLHVTAKCD